MAKTHEQKEAAVQSLKERFSSAKSVVFTNFEGLTVSEMSELRNSLRTAGISYTVAKRTLIGMALKQADLKGADLDQMAGGIGVAFGTDEVAPAKALATFAKKAESLKLIGGFVDGAFLDTAAISQLATMPSKEELLVKLLWLVQYPTTGFVNVLAGSLRKFIYALNAIKESKV
ncbi:MAG: 50S ribosomal protein L10 [Patescibacteria group bacterium]